MNSTGTDGAIIIWNSGVREECCTSGLAQSAGYADRNINGRLRSPVLDVDLRD